VHNPRLSFLQTLVTRFFHLSPIPPSRGLLICYQYDPLYKSICLLHAFLSLITENCGSSVSCPMLMTRFRLRFGLCASSLNLVPPFLCSDPFHKPPSVFTPHVYIIHVLVTGSFVVVMYHFHFSSLVPCFHMLLMSSVRSPIPSVLIYRSSLFVHSSSPVLEST
jgi:hypothetical protein